MLLPEIRILPSFLPFDWYMFYNGKEVMRNGYDFSHDRLVLAMDYLQSKYLKREYTNTFVLIQDALDRLPQGGPIETEDDLNAVRSIGIVIERLPMDDEETAELGEKHKKALQRVRRAQVK